MISVSKGFAIHHSWYIAVLGVLQSALKYRRKRNPALNHEHPPCAENVEPELDGLCSFAQLAALFVSKGETTAVMAGQTPVVPLHGITLLHCPLDKDVVAEKERLRDSVATADPPTAIDGASYLPRCRGYLALLNQELLLHVSPTGIRRTACMALSKYFAAIVQ